MTGAEIILALAAGAIVGLVLGLIGGGGSILAVPLLVYVVGMESTHAAIGTAAVAVALNALAGLLGHARAGRVKWPCALVFGAVGMFGAALGAEIGKSVDSDALLGLFGALMIVVGIIMLRRKGHAENPDVRLTSQSARHLLARLIPIGLIVGLAAGFFGIGGGFLIVPGLVLATAMPLSVAMGTSLVIVTALGLTTAASYAIDGYVDWGLTGLLVAGGIAGAMLGVALARRVAHRKQALQNAFAALVIAMGGYIALG